MTLILVIYLTGVLRRIHVFSFYYCDQQCGGRKPQIAWWKPMTIRRLLTDLSYIRIERIATRYPFWR